MVGFFGCIPRFLKAHSDIVLMSLGSVGLVGTTVAVAKEAPKAETAVMEAELDKMKAWAEENGTNEVPKEVGKLSVWEKTKTVAPIYWPAILLGAATLGCFWGAFIIGAKQQAALVAAYGGLAAQFSQYREEVKAEHGEEADKRAFEFSKRKIKDLQEEIKQLKENTGPFLYEFAALPGVVFEKDPGQIDNVLMHFNRNAMLRGFNTLDELFHFCGIPESCYDVNAAKKYGWKEYENEVTFGIIYIDFYFIPTKNRNGRTVYVIDSYVPPYELEVDYGYEGNVDGHLYEDRNVDKAVKYAEQLDVDHETLKGLTHWCAYAPRPI